MSAMRVIGYVVAAALVPLFSASLQAKSLTQSSVHDAWTVFVLEQNGTRTCYAATPAQVFRPTDNLRLQPYLYVTRYPAPERRSIVEFRFGMDATAVEQPSASIIARNAPPRSTFPIAIKGESGALKNDTDNDTLLQSMLKGRALKVSTDVETEQSLKDIYSLFGITKAVESLEKACP